MTKEEKIQAIYEEIAEGIYDSYSEDETIFPVMIGDVLDYIVDSNKRCGDLHHIKEGYSGSDFYLEICYNWKEKRNPIEEQSDECIDYVYNLIFEKG